MVDLRFCTREVGTVLEDDEVHVAIARREILRGRRASGVHDRRMGLLQRLRLAPDRDGVEALALEIELFVLRPCPAARTRATRWRICNDHRADASARRTCRIRS